MKRRDFISILGGAAVWPRMAHAQQHKMRRIGVLSQTSAKGHPAPLFRALLNGLREKGWEEGRNLAIEWRFSEGKIESLPALAAELVNLAVEVLVTSPTEPTLVAKRATSTIPIVFAQVADPLRAGIVSNLARPEANITGMSTQSTDFAAKRLSLLKEALPQATHFSVLWNRASLGAGMIFDQMRLGEEGVGVELQDVGIAAPADLEASFELAVQARSSAIFLIDDPVMQGLAVAVTALARERKLPLASVSAEYARAGAVMAYGPDFGELYRRAGDYVSRLLLGAKPSDLPVQQPEKFKLLLNLRSAKALGIDMPPTLLARADEVIE
jgi:putative ABC transport system substrate-binding protein